MNIEEHGGKRRNPQPPSVLDLGAKRREAMQFITEQSRLEVIEPGQSNLDERLREYVVFRHRQNPSIGDRSFQDAEIAKLVGWMSTIPVRPSVLRYTGDDVKVESREGASFTLSKGSVIGCNLSKQTMAYPDEYFEKLLAARGRFTMDELTSAVTHPNSPNPYVNFTELENMREGELRHGAGAGFLLLAEVDDRLQGLGLSQQILGGVLDYYRSKVGSNYVFVYGRLPEIRLDAGAAREFNDSGKVTPATVNKYVAQVMDGERRDWGLGFHRDAGASIICGLPYSYPDKESLNCGFLAVYDLRGR
ncbi:MAG: hypothetical protein ABIH11_09075 [Candidatus Altiarchaeota archaeon]